MALDERPDAADLDGLAAQLADLTRERDQLRAALLDASGAADAALRQRAAWFTDGYVTGFESGRQVGYGEAVTDERVTLSDRGWNRPAYADLDRLRYPPDGRLSWLQPRLGDLYELWARHDAEGGE